MSRNLISISTIMTLMSTSVMADVPNVAADIAQSTRLFQE